MATSDKSPLELLDLTGLKKLDSKLDMGKARMARPLADLPVLNAIEKPTLGDLATLPGTWVGTGFNLIQLPNMNLAKPGPPPANKFRVMLNKTAETLIFSSIDGEIVNRGNLQGDISFLGLHYLQQVSDVNLPVGNNGIHLETGLFLNIGKTDAPAEAPSIARLGSIPHGDSVMALGKSFTVNGGPKFKVADPTPFTIENGVRKNDTSEPYLALLKNAVPPHDIPQEAIMNPNLLLSAAIKGQNITKTVVILLDANPIEGVSNKDVSGTVGGITNIPFVNANANATSLSAIFWIETVQNNDGTSFLQLQYTQTVILEFPVLGSDNITPVNIKWPHIAVATLRLQP